MTEDINAVEGQNKSRASAKRRPRLALMYIGPNRPYELPLMRNQVFLGSAPPVYCADLAKVKPHLAACFISVQDAGAAFIALRDRNSDLGRAAAKVAAETAEQLKAANGGK